MLGTTYCTPEIDTSEIVVDVQRQFPMDSHWHFPTAFNSSVVFSNGISLSQWILLEMPNGLSVASSNGLFHCCDFRCVRVCPDRRPTRRRCWI